MIRVPPSTLQRSSHTPETQLRGSQDPSHELEASKSSSAIHTQTSIQELHGANNILNVKASCIISLNDLDVKQHTILWVELASSQTQQEEPDLSYWEKDGKKYMGFNKTDIYEWFISKRHLTNPSNKQNITDNTRMFVTTPETYLNPKEVTQQEIIDEINSTPRQFEHRPSLKQRIILQMYRVAPNTTTSVERFMTNISRNQVNLIIVRSLIVQIALSCLGVSLLFLTSGYIALALALTLIILGLWVSLAAKAFGLVHDLFNGQISLAESLANSSGRNLVLRNEAPTTIGNSQPASPTTTSL